MDLEHRQTGRHQPCHGGKINRYRGQAQNGIKSSGLAFVLGCKKKAVKQNPINKIEDAAQLFEDFSGHRARYVEKIALDWPTHGLTIGKCDGILYTTKRDGKKEHYIHRFNEHARPRLAASHDGKQLLLIGGNFRFTDRGIVDN